MVDFNTSNLNDLALKDWITGEDITEAALDGDNSSTEIGVNANIDAILALESNFESSLAPARNVRGKLYADSTTSNEVELKIDPDGAGSDISIGTATATRFTPASGVSILTIDTAEVSQLGNAAGALMAYTVPANTLSVNNKAIRFTAWGRRDASNADANVEIRWGGTAVSDFTVQLTSSVDWVVQVVVARKASNSQVGYSMVVSTRDAGFEPSAVSNEGFVLGQTWVATETDSATIVFDLFNDGTGNVGDTIAQEGLIVELLN